MSMIVTYVFTKCLRLLVVAFYFCIVVSLSLSIFEQETADECFINWEKFNGSVRPKCLAQVLRALRVKDHELVDFGAGSGRVILSAVVEGESF
jgi:hypothetical protein